MARHLAKGKAAAQQRKEAAAERLEAREALTDEEREAQDAQRKMIYDVNH